MPHPDTLQAAFKGKPTKVSVCKNIHLSLVQTNDAQFILSLRLNENLNTFLSKTTSSLEKQQSWILNYKKREEKGEEYYFIIKDIQGNQLGTVRIYDFNEDSFCWGSWIIHAPDIKSAAIESALSVYDFAFNQLMFKQASFDVRKENTSVIKFHKLMGVREIYSDEVNTYFNYTNLEFASIKKRLSHYLTSEI